MIRDRIRYIMFILFFLVSYLTFTDQQFIYFQKIWH